MSIPRVYRPFASTLLLGALVVSGCGPGTLETKGDKASAHATLTHVLDAWKQGKDSEELTKETPAIYAIDEDWRAGRQLKSFEILDETIENGANWRVYANLSLAGKGAPSGRQKVCYFVELGDPTAVSRSDTLY